MNILFVVTRPEDWPLDVPGVEVVPARAYLTDPAFSRERTARVFNLCKSYRYQSVGYYVSLLAAARGHRPRPSITAIQDMRSQRVVRLLSAEIDEQVRRALGHLQSERFILSIYFGRNITARYNALAGSLFGLFEAPLLRAEFERREGEWQLRGVRPIAAADIPEHHRDFVVEAATRYFAGRQRRYRRRTATRYDLAILHDPEDPEPPSDARALAQFVRAAESVGMSATLITREEAGRLAEFDGLFIRETTAVNHHTYRIARRAEAEGIVVIDDPDSILKCTNKVYLAELLEQHEIPAPRTLIVHRDNAGEIAATLGLPVVLKQPDSAFSRGVIKVDDETALAETVRNMLEQSDLVVAQEFLPTAFDWRVGILDGRPLYVCKYFMARRHWQIIRRDSSGRAHAGNAQTMAVGEAPPEVVRTALRAANLIGNGLYGVDLKQIGRRCHVIEVNDNPSIDAGVEDAVLKGALYREIMGVFLNRIEARKRPPEHT
ncbi:MAG: ATP-grasp domain-containing protein [Gammaproteobacteria bacterium]|nr:MAG: ATP-grasp domain-containing protein [Gammaproteobacteria bacterium]